MNTERVERIALNQYEEARVVGAAKHLLDALNTHDPFCVTMAYNLIKEIAEADKKRFGE